MRIVWSPLAIERAHEAATYIARDKPEAARSWLEGLFEAVDRLEQLPRSGRMIPEIGLPEYREIVYRHSYRIAYYVDKSTVRILTVRHFARLLDLSELGLD
ncbi:MAG: type II toxin-antitoxin system RelE/ParE family toxin [Thermoanaerobaculia bacterium]